MDTLGALALATEPPTDHLMKRSPVGRREPLITNIMWRNLLIQALYQMTILLVLNFMGGKQIKILGLSDDITRNTLIFNAFVLCQVFNEFNARKPEEINVFVGVTKNHLFMAIIGITIVLQIVIIEFLGKFSKTVKLDWKQWLVSVGIGAISWPLAVVGKLLPVPKIPLSTIITRKFRRRLTPAPTTKAAGRAIRISRLSVWRVFLLRSFPSSSYQGNEMARSACGIVAYGALGRVVSLQQLGE